MTGMRRHGLSKSRITAFEQCPKRLWLTVHRPDLAVADENAELRFAAGHAVGAVACALHPDGVMIEAEPNLAAALAETARLIEAGYTGPLFEATFEHEGVLVRVDILTRDGAGGWQLAEVKSSTGPKPYQFGDLATQVWVLQSAGLEVSGAAIRHVDRGFVLVREGDYAGLFSDAELLDVIAETVATRPALVAAARTVLAGDEPDHPVGDHCTAPFVCEFADYCHRDLPSGAEWPVTILPQGAGRKWLERGVTDLLALDEAKLTPGQARIVRATRSGVVERDPSGARRAMADWTYPRAWLDFETIAFAVPRWIGTRPYEQVPFQFSLHLEQAEGTITHHQFLSLDGTDPRSSCAEALIEAIPTGATVIAYNAGFERGVLRALAAFCPHLADRLEALATRTVDLLPVTRANWYHRDQRGSWSIKAVLPTLSALDYASLEVKDGGDAQLAWLEAVDPTTTPERRWAIGEALSAYCARDTWAMIEVARALVA